jgi:MFS family permease
LHLVSELFSSCFLLNIVICGIGFGATYTPPLQALIDWFPDKKGLASGLVIAGFGSGALVFAPAINHLQSQFVVIPQFLGKTIKTVTEDGKMFTDMGDGLREVVFATATDLAKLPYSDLAEGFYLVGSGNTGVAPSLAIIAGMYFVTCVTSAFILKRPSPGARFTNC